MAIKDKTKQNQEHRITTILTREYKYENLFLGLVAVISGVFSVMIINGTLTVNSDFPIIGENGIVFGWVLFSISMIGLILALFPFFQPALPEIRKVTWPTVLNWLANCGRVVFFMAIFIALYLMFSVVIKEFLSAIGA